MSAPLPLVVTPGDPDGIGPEVTHRALVRFEGPVVVIGDGRALRRLSDRFEVQPPSAPLLPRSDGRIAVIDPGDRDEPVEVASIRLAVQAALDGRARAVVTGPIHKAKLARRGFPHPGHTEFVAALCGVERPVMAFVGGRVRVSLVTVHLPLREVVGQLTVERVLHTVRLSAAALRDRLGIAGRIAVCGPNPHAGDEGVLGTEDRDLFAPAVQRAVDEGIDAYGPVSAEAAFRAAVRGEAEWVVAAYHDQGLAPLKALEWADVRPDAARAVNWTLGLPIVRVGVDHGTAYEIAGRGVADAGSMLASLRLAERLG